MIALDTEAQWAAALGEMAAWRAGRQADEFAFALGVDPAALVAFCRADAVDTIRRVIPASIESGADPQVAVVAALAMQTQLGVEFGLWLATTPEGRRYLEAPDAD